MFKKLLIVISSLLISLSGFGQVKRDLAQQAMDEGRYEEAIKDWKDLYKSDPNDFYYEQIVNCYIQLEEYSDAEEFIDKHMVAARARRDLYRIDLGYISLLKRDTTEAEDRFNQVLESIYNQPGLAYQYSERFKNWGVYQFALGALETAERSNPSLNFDHQKARLFAEMGMLEEMYKAYLDVLEDNESFLSSFQNIIRFNTNRNGEIPLSTELKAEIISRIQAEKGLVFNRLLVWVLTQEEEYRQAFRQLSALYRRQRVEAFEIFQLAQNAMQSKAYRDAISIYEFLIEESTATPFYGDAIYGKISASHLSLLEKNATQAEFEELHNEIIAAEQLLRGNSLRADLLLLRAEIEYLHLHDAQLAVETIDECLNSIASNAQLAARAKLLRGNIELAEGMPYDAILTFADVETEFEGGLLGQEARFRKARVAFYIGDFEFALIQFDVLKRSTSKLIANDALRLSLLIKDNAALDTTYMFLEMYTEALLRQAQNDYPRALLELDSLDVMLQFSEDHPLLDESMYTRARILEDMGQLDSAASLYIKIANDFHSDLLADESLIRAARIYQYELFDLAKAKDLYEQMLLEHINSIYAEEARTEFRKLRGDLNS